MLGETIIHPFIGKILPPAEFDELISSFLQAFDLQPAAARIVLLAKRQNDLRVSSSCGYPDPETIQDLIIPLTDFPFLADVLEKGAPVVVETGADFSAIEHSLGMEMPGNYLLKPLQFHDQLIGLLIFHLAGRRIGNQETRLANLMAEQIALRAGSKAIQSERHRKMLHLEIASQVSKKVNSILELDQMLQEVVRLIRFSLGYDHVHIFLVDGHAHQIALQVLSGEKREPLEEQGLRFAIGDQAITAWVASQGEKLVANNVSEEPLYFQHELLPNVRSEAAFPMRVGDTVVGVLDVQSDQLDAFDEDDIFTLQIVADQTAIGVENAHLFEETRRQADVYQALHELSLEITSQLENDDVLGMILKFAANFLNATASSLAIYDEKENALTIKAGYNNSASLIGKKLDVGEGVVGQVVATRAPVFVNNYQSWEHHSPKLNDNRYSAVLGVPLLRREKIIGSLVALDYRERRHFTNTDAQKLALFADFASIALKKYELFDEIRKSRQELERKVVKRTGELSETQVALKNAAEELRQLLEVTVNIQEEERARIALDLHDGSNQLITGILYELQAAQQSILNENTEITLNKLETAKKLLRTIEAENRRIISGLRPTILDTDGLIPALKWYVKRQMKIYDLQIHFRASGEIRPLPKQVETAIFRIVQESLHNIVEHAHAKEIQIKAHFTPSDFQLSVIDDGVGLDLASSEVYGKERMGLIGMKERAQSIQGTLKIDSLPGQGVTIRLIVPNLVQQ